MITPCINQRVHNTKSQAARPLQPFHHIRRRSSRPYRHIRWTVECPLLLIVLPRLTIISKQEVTHTPKISITTSTSFATTSRFRLNRPLLPTTATRVEVGNTSRVIVRCPSPGPVRPISTSVSIQAQVSGCRPSVGSTPTVPALLALVVRKLPSMRKRRESPSNLCHCTLRMMKLTTVESRWLKRPHVRLLSKNDSKLSVCNKLKPWPWPKPRLSAKQRSKLLNPRNRHHRPRTSLGSSAASWPRMYSLVAGETAIACFRGFLAYFTSYMASAARACTIREIVHDATLMHMHLTIHATEE